MVGSSSHAALDDGTPHVEDVWSQSTVGEDCLLLYGVRQGSAVDVVTGNGGEAGLTLGRRATDCRSSREDVCKVLLVKDRREDLFKMPCGRGGMNKDFSNDY